MDRLTFPDLGAIAAAPDRLPWRPLRPGIEIHRLYGDGERGPSAAFLRYAPGARLARHRHTGSEHILVLAGAQEDEHGVYRAGALVINLPESAHTVSSREGCIVLAMWASPVRFDDE